MQSVMLYDFDVYLSFLGLVAYSTRSPKVSTPIVILGKKKKKKGFKRRAI